MVSRLVCEAFHGPAPSAEHQAAHRNGVRTDNRPSNLRWLTRHENYQDQVRHGTDRRGERHHLAVLTAQDVREIRALSGTMLQREIAARFAVTQGQVSSIINRKIWAHA